MVKHSGKGAKISAPVINRVCSVGHFKTQKCVHAISISCPARELNSSKRKQRKAVEIEK